MSMTFDGSDITAMAADLGSSSVRVRRQASVVVRKSTLDTQRVGMAGTPVDTGNLRNSWSSEFADGGLTGETGPTAEYADYVEAGTSTQAPQPYMVPAFEANEPTFVDAVARLADVIL